MSATLEYSPSVRDLKEEKLRRRLKGDFPSFFRMHSPGRNYTYGRMFDEVSSVLDGVTKSVEEGVSRYVCVCIPVRHGKSDLVSRRWMAWNMIRNPRWEQILAGYSFNLVSGISHDVRALIRRVGEWYGIKVESDRGALESWSIADHGGRFHSVGIGGTITGRGATMLVLDDAYKNRKEAESEIIRQSKWESFESDMLTRLAPIHAVVLVQNRWHPDDLVGRILNKNDPEHEDYDPEFPVFEQLTFPAHDEDGAWLLPERFSERWYKSLRAFLGNYAWQSQGLQAPVARGGNIFNVDGITEVDEREFPETKYVRFWDLASTEQERTGHKPSWTVGALVGVTHEVDSVIPSLWVKDVQFCREEAPKRDRLVMATTEKDGPSVPVLVESVAGYKDAATTLKAILKGKRLVRKVPVSRDKLTNASPLEPLFEAGNVFVPRGAKWLPFFRQQFGVFPSGDNDDVVDSTAGGYRHHMKRMKMTSALSGLTREALGF